MNRDAAFALSADEANVKLLISLVVELAARCGVSNHSFRSWVRSEVANFGRYQVGEGAKLIRKDEMALLTAMLSVWRWNPRFVDELGEPVRLRIDSDGPSLRELHSLAASMTNLDIENALTVKEALKALQLSGSIASSDGQLYSRLRDDVPVKTTGARGASSQLGYLADMAATVKYNLGTDTEHGRFCGVSTFDNVPIDVIKRIERLCWEGGMEWLKEVDSLMFKSLQKARSGASQSESRGRAGVGVFLIARDSQK